MASREMPPTRGAQRYKKLLEVAWIAAIVGITISASTLLNAIVQAPFSPPETVWRRAAKHAVMVVGWSIILWIAHRGTRRNLAPPEWLVFALSLLIAVAALL